MLILQSNSVKNAKIHMIRVGISRSLSVVKMKFLIKQEVIAEYAHLLLMKKLDKQMMIIILQEAYIVYLANCSNMIKIVMNHYLCKKINIHISDANIKFVNYAILNAEVIILKKQDNQTLLSQKIETLKLVETSVPLVKMKMETRYTYNILMINPPIYVVKTDNIFN